MEFDLKFKEIGKFDVLTNITDWDLRRNDLRVMTNMPAIYQLLHNHVKSDIDFMLVEDMVFSFFEFHRERPDGAYKTFFINPSGMYAVVIEASGQERLKFTVCAAVLP